MLGLWLLSCLGLGGSYAQNLVVNGGFERQSPRTAGVWQAPPKACSFSSSSQVWNTSAQGWLTFEVQTPDLLLNDSVAGCPHFPAPRRGQRMVGLIMFHPFQDGQFAFDYHELIQGSLTKPLEKGKTYKISFWAYTDDSLGVQHLNKVYGRTTGIKPVMCNNFGFYFSEGPINTKENFMLSQTDFPVKPQVSIPQIVETKGKWRKLSLAYTPDRNNYRHFLFGNFSFDGATAINMGDHERMQLDEANQSLPFWKKTKRIAYYLFDDFSIVEDPEAHIEQSLLTEGRYAMQEALLFDFGQAALRPQSAEAVRKLAQTLLRNPALRFEVAGHTDAVGDEATNQALSEARAQALHAALLAQGVPPTQLAWKGYGKTQPVADNATEAGRQRNRRVECRLVE